MQRLGNIILWLSAALALTVLTGDLYLAFTDYRDGLSYDSALIVIALAAAIMFVGIMAKRILRDNF
jgi:ABC-type uncharacterized transport system permease subunit